MREYNFSEIEQKWQDRWYNSDAFKAVDFHPTKPKYYVLYEFFNISGNLHMGHMKATPPTDALARYKRFCGYNVLFPIGGDAFGLPAENAAIKTGIDPHVFVKETSDRMFAQAKKMGLSFDFDRVFNTSDPDYYKWTQWIFLQLYKNGKAYKELGKVNFCPNCQTTLSNEDSQGGKCDRCGGDVIQVDRNVWWLKMKEYSEKLLGNVDRIEMAENLKEAQRNWIGKSVGAQVKFDFVDECGNKLDEVEIFTTCPETIYGVTFLAMAPEHKLVDKFASKITNMSEVQAYRQQTILKKDLDRRSSKEKSGCILKGIYAINPVNNNKVPVLLADFVLVNYATGVVMAVPTHDQRDYEIAKMFDIPMIQVIEGDVSCQAVEKKEYLSKNSLMLNSGEFTGMRVLDAKEKIIDMLINMGVGRRQINYLMTDWSFNRQRYWGEPIPIIFCDNCGTVPVDEKDLPLVLPKVKDYLPNKNGDSPISKVSSWVEVVCPKCGAKAKRETDTMPNWAGSSWYWLRYCDPHNNNALADYQKLKYWGSVDCYTGGTEHITRHVLYAFFWQNFLYDIGAVPTRDPFIRKMGSGLILDSEGKKMSKSSANGVTAMEVINKYGADVARLHTMFLGGYTDNNKWTFDGIEGIISFLNRVWNLPDIIKGEEVSKEHAFEINSLIKKLGQDYENLSSNTAIAACMSFVKKVKEDKFITKQELKMFLIGLNPMAPHITSELFEEVFGHDIMQESWPKYDESCLQKDELEIPIQVNGKLRGKIVVSKSSSEQQIKDLALKEVESYVQNGYKKIIYIPGRIFNIVV